MFDYCAPRSHGRWMKAALREAVWYCALQRAKGHGAGLSRCRKGEGEGNLPSTGGLQCDCAIRKQRLLPHSTLQLFTLGGSGFLYNNQTLCENCLKEEMISKLQHERLQSFTAVKTKNIPEEMFGVSVTGCILLSATTKPNCSSVPLKPAAL